jgi:thiamine biosynthesis protein ThiS
MKVSVNAEETTLDRACTVQELLAQRGLVNRPCAVEVNRRLVPKRCHEDHVLSEGDQIEIVTLVGGG